jgi:hypothetical protein
MATDAARLERNPRLLVIGLAAALWQAGVAHEAGDDLQLQSELASAYEKIGDLQGAPGRPNLSDFNGALTSLEKAKAIRLKMRC